MSLLTPAVTTVQTQSAATLARIKANDDKAAVDRLMAYPAQAFARRLDEATKSFAEIWGAPVPADRIALLNTQAPLRNPPATAAQLFALAAGELAYLESLQAGCTAAIQATVKPTTSHDDGTVTLT